MKKIYIIFVFVILLSLTSCACGGYPGYYYGPNASVDAFGREDEGYEKHTELDYVDTKDEAEMYLSLDNSSYSYTDIRNYINQGMDVPTSAVNIEEMLNYFDYGYEAEEGINIKAEVSTCPWNTEHLLETIAIYAPLTGVRQNANITFLVDVSGSMSGKERLGLFQDAFEAVLPYLTENDKISLVTYANDSKVILDGVTGDKTTKINNSIQGLRATGCTNGEDGIQKAYKVAQKNFITDGINHIFIVTDGDFNIGIDSEDELATFVRSYANEGIYLSIFGVGMYNTRQSMIQTIKKNGDGNCYYLDSVEEASQALELALKGGMRVLTKDTKAKVSFDPEYVSSYRLLGYENKLLTEEEYEDEDTNAGEIFEGYQVMIVFELVPTKEMDKSISTIEIKYKDSKTNENKVVSQESIYSNSEAHQFAALVAEFGLILRESNYKGIASYNHIKELSEGLSDYINLDQKRVEFTQLVLKAQKNSQNNKDTSHYYNA